MKPVYAALLHYPVRDRAGAVITTAVTNLDVHDIARSARTYGLAGYFIVTPVEAQALLVGRILEHWREGPGSRRVPERTEALALVRLVPSLAMAIDAIKRETGERPLTLVTGARAPAGRTPLQPVEARAKMQEAPTILVFGTGHGLAPEVVAAADEVLAPIRGGASYNHLSVRAAAAILLDRLFGEDGAD